MGSLSIWHWLIIGVVVLLVFGGKGKISDIMGDFAKGIKSFKKGLSDEDESSHTVDTVKALEPSSVAATADKSAEARKVG